MNTNTKLNTEILTGQEAARKISKMLKEVKHEIRIASAWFPKTTLLETFLTASIRDRLHDGTLKMTVLCRFGAAFDVSLNGPMIEYARTLGISIYVAKTTHAKTLIVDDREIVAGSFNFTGSGLASEEVRELGAWTDDHEAVAKGIADYKKMLSAAQQFPPGNVAVVLAASASGQSLLCPISMRKPSRRNDDEEMEYGIGGKSAWGIDLELWKIGAHVTIEHPDITGINGDFPVRSEGMIIDVISMINSDRLSQELGMKAMYGNEWGVNPGIIPAALGTLTERRCYVLVKWKVQGDLHPIVNPSEFAVLVEE